MISKVINGKEFLFVEVPQYAYEFQVYNNLDTPIIDYWKETGSFAVGEIELEKNNEYKLIGKASDLSEEQWDGIVERWDSGKYNDYERFLSRVSTATLSGLSLISSLNLKPETTLIIQKQ